MNIKQRSYGSPLDEPFSLPLNRFMLQKLKSNNKFYNKKKKKKGYDPFFIKRTNLWGFEEKQKASTDLSTKKSYINSLEKKLKKVLSIHFSLPLPLFCFPPIGLGRTATYTK